MNESINFEVKSDALAVIQTLSIDANFDQMEAYLREMLDPYKTLVVTDVAAAKKDRAFISKIEKSIDDSRKLVKKLYQQPLTEFENKVKALTAICDSASVAIDTQIKEIENAEKAERMAELRAYFDEASAGDTAEYITWERIASSKWETKSYGMENAKADIDRAIEATRQNIEVIKAMSSPYETSLLLVLRETGDIGKVMQKKAACEALDRAREAQEQNRAQEAAQKAAESREAPTHTETPPPAAEASTAPKTYVFTLEFEATKEQAYMIEAFFRGNGIKYRKVR